MNSQHTTDDLFPENELPSEEPSIRFLDIHLYEQEPEPAEPDGIESDPEPEPQEEHTAPARPLRAWRPLMVLSLCLVVIVLIAGLLWVFVPPLLTPDATVTIVPITQQVRTTTTITVTPGQATGTQLHGRTLAALTMSQQQTVPTTGNGHQDAQAAHGFLTFYNAAPYGQTIAAGMLVTGTDGVQVVTDADAWLPAGTLATNGQASVPAHAIQAGPQGNIRAGDIYGACCRVNVLAANTVFQGGHAARDYPMVTQHDLRTVVTNLQTSLNQSVQAALQAQVHPDETLITPLPCQPRVQADHHPGEEAVQVTVTLSETCTAVTYKTQALQAQMTARLAHEARTRLGDGYSMQGVVHPSVRQAIPYGKTLLLQVSGVAVWGYVFSAQQQAQIKEQVAGKSKAQAIATLLHTPGVQTVSVQGSSTLPTDASRIHFVFVLM